MFHVLQVQREFFKGDTPLLEARFHVIGVDYDGFDGEGTEFPDMMTVTQKIERYISENFESKVNIIYGSSLDSSDLDQSTVLSAKLKVALFGDMLYKMLKSGKMPDKMMKRTKQKLGEEGHMH